MDPAGQAAAVRQMLGEARDLGFLGPGPIDRHIEHARGFALAAAGEGREKAFPEGGSSPRTGAAGLRQVLDLGSGGGLPGLVLALEWPESRLVLLEVGVRRAEFLRRAVGACGLEDRVAVLHCRAETAGRDPGQRGSYDLVVARSFGPPAVTAECAAPLLRPGGLLVVSAPPEEETAARWPASGLAQLGMSASRSVRGQFGYRVVPQRSACPERFPRRVGVPAKRPLF